MSVSKIFVKNIDDELRKSKGNGVFSPSSPSNLSVGGIQEGWSIVEGTIETSKFLDKLIHQPTAGIKEIECDPPVSGPFFDVVIPHFKVTLFDEEEQDKEIEVYKNGVKIHSEKLDTNLFTFQEEEPLESDTIYSFKAKIGDFYYSKDVHYSDDVVIALGVLNRSIRPELSDVLNINIKEAFEAPDILAAYGYGDTGIKTISVPLDFNLCSVFAEYDASRCKIKRIYDTNQNTLAYLEDTMEPESEREYSIRQLLIMPICLGYPGYSVYIDFELNNKGGLPE